MPSLCVFGLQWGDEGKGKIIDLLAREADYVVRFQGGANAGHTVVVGDDTYVLHLVPSGILHPEKVNVIGNGVAVDPLALIAEIEGLVERGIRVSGANLHLAGGAHVIFEHHRRLDALSERWRGAGRIGTTGRGIGPCYADKAARTGLRIAELLDPERCRVRLGAALAEKNTLLSDVHGEPALDLEEQLARYIGVGDRLRPFVTDTGEELRQAFAAGRSLLFEGAQGVMLDLDQGTYPFVTSSSTGVNGVASGAGFPPGRIERSIGIAKAYCTRVGEGPFPSEDHGADGEALREAGNEYGATTGRPRRCGWFDALAVRYALEINGADGWVMTNLDVLTGFPSVKVAVAYRRGSERWTRYPGAVTGLEDIEVELEERPAWSEPIGHVRRYEDLPAAAREVVEWIEGLVGSKVRMLSVGPERDQVIPRGL